LLSKFLNSGHEETLVWQCPKASRILPNVTDNRGHGVVEREGTGSGTPDLLMNANHKHEVVTFQFARAHHQAVRAERVAAARPTRGIRGN
jgi:hypothetical protein